MPPATYVQQRPAHSPCERRIDGDRVTELIPAREWLSRPDKNQLERWHNQMPPQLPRYASRDHLHDRNRELNAFDPANPGIDAYVRVTRRRHPDRAQEQALHQQRKDRLLEQAVLMEMEAEKANELLELRSQGIRNMLAARSRGWNQPPPTEATRTREARVNDLEHSLRAMRATYEYKGFSKPTDQKGSNLLPTPTRMPAPAARTTLRGGWPVEEQAFGYQA